MSPLLYWSSPSLRWRGRVGAAGPTAVCLARLPGAACACWLELLHEVVDKYKYEFSPVRKSAQRQIFGLKCVMQPSLFLDFGPRGESSYAWLNAYNGGPDVCNNVVQTFRLNGASGKILASKQSRELGRAFTSTVIVVAPSLHVRGSFHSTRRESAAYRPAPPRS